MPIALNNTANFKVQLQQIAQMAYGSGRTEKTSGGEGYIGLIGDHVIKFATHGEERPRGGIKVTDDIKDSCNALRQKLGDLAKEAFNGKTSSASLHKIYASLGLGEDGRVKADLSGKKVLLSRKVVAKTLNAIQKQMGDSGNVWEKARERTATNRHAMTEDKTNFDTVASAAKAATLTEKAVNFIRNLETPLDRKLKDVLTGTTVNGEFNLTQKLMDYVNTNFGMLPTVDDHKMIWRVLKELQTGLQGARNAYADVVEKHLATAVKEQTVGPDAQPVDFARAAIKEAHAVFGKAIDNAFGALSKCEKKVAQTIRNSLTVWADEEFRSQDFKNLLETDNSVFATDPHLDYKEFFETHFNLAGIQKDLSDSSAYAQ